MFKRPLDLASLVAIAAVLLVSAELRHAEAARLAADDVLREIKSEGPGPVLWRLWDNPTRFDAVCDKIASGDPSWLEVARRLRPSSDAGASLSLDYAVARALPLVPERVLRLVNDGFTVDDICTSPFIEPEPGVAERYQRRASAALRGSLPSDLEAVRKECLKRVEVPLHSTAQ